jgi:hypothetical protein
MSALAERTGAINLGQGFPDTDGRGGSAPGGRLEYVGDTLVPHRPSLSRA